MLIIDSPSHNPYFNIASEEYLLGKYPDQEIFLLYINAPSIIVGKFQNTLAEINLDFVNKNEIKVVRRLTGGGAVYHDLGNLNFSFHSLNTSGEFMDFGKFTQPVLSLLNSLEVPAKLEGRNDLLVDGKKFSGNAKLVRKKKVIHHGTILIDSEMSRLTEALKVNPLKFVDKAIKSVRKRVTNLIEYLPENTTTESFKKLLINQVIKENDNTVIHVLTEQEIRDIDHLADTKYNTWDWNFGYSPAYNFSKAIKIPAGFIEFHLDVEGGIIEKAKIFGDFFANSPIEELERALVGQKHEIGNIRTLLNELDLSLYFGNASTEEVIEAFK
jgi:lipoate-protein ligase A